MKQPSEMTDQELVEAFFVEVYGWDVKNESVPLPILNDDLAFNAYVLPVIDKRIAVEGALEVMQEEEKQ